MAGRTYTTIQLLLAVLSAVTGALGIYILTTDNILWEFRPSHGFALIGFVIVFFILSGLVFLRERLAILALPVWAVVQLLLIIGDIALGLFSGFTPGEAAGYLFFEQPGGGFVPYFVLLLILLILSLAVFVRSRRTPT
ncbi:MAG: hypothetical protein ACE5HJ_02005 [Thermoplasmata archaeon]